MRTGGNCRPSARCSRAFHARPPCFAPPIGTWKPPTNRSRHRNMSAERQTLDEVGRLLESKALTSEAVTEKCLTRITEQNRSLNAFITVLVDEAMAQAREADRELAEGRYRG